MPNRHRGLRARASARGRGRVDRLVLRHVRPHTLAPFYYRALLRGAGRQQRRGSPRITIPTLMIWGEADRALGKELTYGTERYVANLSLHYLPTVSHWVQQEAPEAVNGLIETWLRLHEG